jgi:hypothetical protein
VIVLSDERAPSCQTELTTVISAVEKLACGAAQTALADLERTSMLITFATEPRYGFDLQPNVAAQRLRWVIVKEAVATPMGLRRSRH